MIVEASACTIMAQPAQMASSIIYGIDYDAAARIIAIECERRAGRRRARPPAGAMRIHR